MSASKAEVTIQFNGPIPEAFYSNADIENVLKKFHGDPTVNVQVFETLEVGEGTVYFELYSGNLNNLNWQNKLLLRYLQANHANDVICLNSNVWTVLDDYGIYFDGNDEVFKDL